MELPDILTEQERAEVEANRGRARFLKIVAIVDRLVSALTYLCGQLTPDGAEIAQLRIRHLRRWEQGAGRIPNSPCHDMERLFRAYDKVVREGAQKHE